MPIYVHTFKACEALCKNAYYNKIRLQLSYRTWVIDALQIPKRSVAMRSPVCERTASMLSGRAAITAAASSGMPSWFAVFICNTSSGTTHVAQRSTPRRSSMKPGLGPVPRGPSETAQERCGAPPGRTSPLYTLNAGSCFTPSAAQKRLASSSCHVHVHKMRRAHKPLQIVSRGEGRRQQPEDKSQAKNAKRAKSTPQRGPGRSAACPPPRVRGAARAVGGAGSVGSAACGKRPQGNRCHLAD